MDGSLGRIEDRAERHAAAVRAAMRSVRREVRGLPPDAAAERLVRALREHNAYVPPSQLRGLARHLADPWWLVKHPIRGTRELRREASAGVDPDSLRMKRQADEVCARLERLLAGPDGSIRWSVNAERSFDGMRYEVAIDPYSDARACRLRDAMAPLLIVVRPHRG